MTNRLLTKNENNSLSSGLNKEDHMIVAQRLGDMEKRRVGTRFIDREATEEDQAKPLMEILGTGIWLLSFQNLNTSSSSEI